MTKLRHNLSDESTCAATVLHSWSLVQGLIPESEIIQIFREKSKRSKAVGNTSESIVVVED